MAGRVDKPVSDRRQADERRCGVQPSRVVLAPRRWCQVLRRRRRPDRARTLPSIRKATVARKPDHREEHEAAVNPLRAERRVFWCICKDCARLFVFGRRWLRVHQAPGVPTPSRGGNEILYLARKNHAARSRSHILPSLRGALATKQSIFPSFQARADARPGVDSDPFSLCRAMDCSHGECVCQG